MSEHDDAETADSLWVLKPWWCQPWSILLTGFAVVLGSWVIAHLWWLTALVAIPVLLWWWLFLVLVPAAWRQEQLAARQVPAPHSPG